MKKLFIILKSIFLVAGIVLLALAPSFEGISYINVSNVNPKPGTMFSMVLLSTVVASSLFYVALGVGAFLSFSRNKISNKIGCGLLLGTSIIALTCFMTCFTNVNGSLTYKIGIGSIIALVGAISTVIGLFFDLMLQFDKAPKEEQESVHNLLLWKDLLDKNVITSEEFETKKKEILHLKEVKKSEIKDKD